MDYEFLQELYQKMRDISDIVHHIDDADMRDITVTINCKDGSEYSFVLEDTNIMNTAMKGLNVQLKRRLRELMSIAVKSFPRAGS